MSTGEQFRPVPAVAADRAGADLAPELVPCLGIVYPRDLHQCFRIGVAPRTIGSGQNADIVLNDERIAPIHCRVSMVDGRVLIEDLGSESGTWIEDERVAAHLLEPGQMLRVGHYRFMLSSRETRHRDAGTPQLQRPGTDPVTGVPNRAWILRRAAAVLEARADSPRPLTLALLAPDGLHRLHRERGYRAGDLLMRRLAHLVEGRLREKESLGQLGPEKLMVLMPEVEREDALVRLESWCRLVRAQSLDEQGGGARVTLSVGFATRAATHIPSLDRFLIQADQALYQARQAGGDRVLGLG